MLSLLTRSTVLFLLFAASCAGDSPVAKVIKLLEDLKKEVESEGKKEATAYGKYACFCKDTTKTKSESITTGQDKIGTLSADITDSTASKEEKEAQVKERKNTHTQLGKDLSATVARCSTAQAKYESGAADIAKAIESLNKAIKAMSEKKGKMGAASLLSSDKDVKKALALANILLDPSDPAYKYHSKEINNILAKLLKDFTDEKQDIEDKWGKTSAACTEEKDGLNKKMKDNLEAIAKAEELIQELAKKIAKDRGDLVNAQEVLLEDETYLKDLTAQCETKAKDFDQRASMRNDEVQALSQALKIMGDKVEGADAEVNKRSFVQHSQNAIAEAVPKKPLSFLQAAPVKAVTNFLAREEVANSEQVTQEKVVSLLRSEGTRLASPELSAVAMRITEDHFKKVKAIIQTLIERLLDEAKAEASKKGFCDTEIAKAKEDRDNAHEREVSMSAELKELEATKEELEAEMEQLGKDIKESNEELKKATELRQTEKEENTDTLKTAHEGLAALNEAILILKAFYSSAARASSLLQASPVDEDTSGPGFGGSYKGQQKSSRAIFALLETIAADFSRTISKTEQAEAESAAEFVKLERTSKSNIGSKETKTKLNEQDLKSTETSIARTLDDLKTEQGLLDDALAMVESLKPACLDAGGMNYKERTAKRKEEIAALNKALCILTPGKKEGDCD